MTLAPPHRPLEGYPPIAEHGVIGNLHTVALVGVDGTIDWYCPERFDSPSVFGSILDRRRGGFYRIAPRRDDVSSKQLYLPDTNILITRFLSPDGVVEVQDFMPVGANHQPLVRRVVGVRGEVPMRIEIEPRFDYGRVVHERRTHPNGVSFHTDDLDLSLASDLTLTPTPTGGVVAEVVAQERSAHALVLHHGSLPELLSEEQTEALGEETIAYWRRWLCQSSYVGRWREMVNRSALTLKLLTYAPTGAMVAAPTTSLPEQVGGTRNWDYRFSWTRDFAFSIYALTRLGFAEEAQALTWFGRSAAGEACRRPGANGPLRVLYGIDPTSITDEQVLDHWEGYRGLCAGADRERGRASAPTRHLRRVPRRLRSGSHAHGSNRRRCWRVCPPRHANGPLGASWPAPQGGHGILRRRPSRSNRHRLEANHRSGRRRYRHRCHGRPVLMGITAARMHNVVPRALGVAIVAVPEWRHPVALHDRDGVIQFVERKTDALDAELMSTELGQCLVTTPEQTVLDLAHRPDLGKVAEEVQGAIAALLPRCDQRILERIAAEQRLKSTLERVRRAAKAVT